jgi:hypothetical protein
VAILVEDCPRCGANKITLDCVAETALGIEYGWQRRFEVFSVCRHCHLSTVFIVRQAQNNQMFGEQLRLHGLIAAAGVGSINNSMSVHGYVSAKDRNAVAPPEHLPDGVKEAFAEGAKCLAVGCHNAAGTMFRLAVDLATRPMLPAPGDQSVPYKTRRDLGLRLPWLFANNKLPKELEDLSHAVREEGNDGAHQGTLTADDAQDLLDFAFSLFERMFTEPERLRQRQIRRDARQSKPEAKP